MDRKDSLSRRIRDHTPHQLYRIVHLSIRVFPSVVPQVFDPRRVDAGRLRGIPDMPDFA